MSGIKGRSGGARPNTGGARVGAGRKPNPPVILDVAATNDPLQFLRLVMDNNDADIKLRIAAAVALMPYVHAKRSDTGKKDEAEKAAKKASTGRYASSAPPVRLVT